MKHSSLRSTENDAEIIAEAKQNLEAVRNDEMPKEHPDGTAGHEWEMTYDEDGNEITKPYKKKIRYYLQYDILKCGLCK